MPSYYPPPRPISPGVTPLAGINVAPDHGYTTVSSVATGPKYDFANGEDDDNKDEDSEPLPAVPTEIYKVDRWYDPALYTYDFQPSGMGVLPEDRLADGKTDPWRKYCFVVIRDLPQAHEKRKPFFLITVKSKFLLKACKVAVGEVAGVSWNAIPLELDPFVLLARITEFKAYRDTLAALEDSTDEDKNVLSTVEILINYFQTDYRDTIASIENFKAHGEISFDFLWAIFLPRDIIIHKNSLTGDLEALSLISIKLIQTNCGPIYLLTLEGIDVGHGDDSNDAEVAPFMRTERTIALSAFQGIQKVISLEAYPLSCHPNKEKIKERLIERGRRWAGIAGTRHHMHYRGTGTTRSLHGPSARFTVNCRVMIDRVNFAKSIPDYPYPEPKKEIVTQDGQINPYGNAPPPPRRSRRRRDSYDYNGAYPGQLGYDNVGSIPNMTLTDEDLLLTSPVVYGFSLADKRWLEFDVEKLSEIQWDEEAFSNLIIPEDRKTLLRSLVEAHNSGSEFDDFISGKGRGLVINLFGPPGVGKTLSAEATSEYVKKPLYVIGSGDLGTNAVMLDHQLQKVFQLATAWKAIVLIDEADVFLEQRSMHDLERNAMVAIFLRHLEYYPAILFLTTNRLKTFDHAFLSRIHIALHFHDLSNETLKSIWIAFLKKAGVTIGEAGGVSEAQLEDLAKRIMNGRQVKNAVKTSTSLAISRKESLSYAHLVQVLDVMEQFTVEFQTMTVGQQ